MTEPAEPRYWEDFPVGLDAVHGTHAITEEEIVRFAREFDPQAFHTDPEAARETPFGGLIASGWHTAALYMGMFVRSQLLAARAWARPASRSSAGSSRSGPATRSPHAAGRRGLALGDEPRARHDRRRARARQPARRGRDAVARPRVPSGAQTGRERVASGHDAHSDLGRRRPRRLGRRARQNNFGPRCDLRAVACRDRRRARAGITLIDTADIYGAGHERGVPRPRRSKAVATASSSRRSSACRCPARPDTPRGSPATSAGRSRAPSAGSASSDRPLPVHQPDGETPLEETLGA